MPLLLILRLLQYMSHLSTRFTQITAEIGWLAGGECEGDVGGGMQK